MIQRVLEPEAMDTPEEAAEYDSMDHSEVNRRFAKDVLSSGLEAMAAGAGRRELEVLDLGTGTAQIPIELCRQSEGFRISAVDLAASMLDVARLNVEVVGCNTRIRLDLVDAKALPYNDGAFDAVVSNSIVHHIPEPVVVLAEAIRVLRPGGLFFFRDLARPESEMELSRLVETYAADANDRQRQLFADSLRAALSLDEMRDLARRLGRSAEEVRPTSDRHWTWSFRSTD